MIKKYTLKTLEKAINHALSLDPSTTNKLKKLQNSVVQIIIKPLAISFFMSFDIKGINLLPEANFAQTIIESTPLGLIRLAVLPASKARSLFNDQIKISGDIELGQKIKQLFDTLDIDWEGYLAQFTGDVAAYQLGNWVRKTKNITSQAASSLRQNLQDYLQNELQIFPTQEEVEDFFDDIDLLVQDTERLEAKFELMNKNK